MRPPLETIIEQAPELPVLVLVVDLPSDVAHLIEADAPDWDVAMCGIRSAADWEPTSAWPAGRVCKDCLRAM